jgi:NADP-dependent 3-hydroxy acid dehydrogenase YdfG
MGGEDESVSDLPMRGLVALVARAGKGIGAVTAQAFADAGAAVVVAARDAAAVPARS